MLNIEIISGNPDDGTLELTDNGYPSNGNSKARRGWGVHWKVKDKINVAYIEDIKIKRGITAPPSIDIFSKDRPKPQGGSHRTHWKATVNKDAKDAPDGAEYNYEIHWVERGSTEIRVFDPKIAVDPDKDNFLKYLILGLLSLISIEFLRRKWGKNKFSKKY